MKISKTELAEMYRTMKIKDIKSRLGNLSNDKLYALFDQCGIQRKVKNRRPRNTVVIQLVED